MAAVTVAPHPGIVEESNLQENSSAQRVNGANGAYQAGVEQGPDDVIILGGGVAGLACGLELARHGWRVTVLEKAGEVGGLARTVQHAGYRFDIGGHRFHSHNPRLLRWLQELLGAELLRVKRRSHIYLQGQYVRYPLQFPEALRIFGPRQLLAVLGSYMAARWQQRHAATGPTTFEEWVVRRFGRALFDVYFRPYTEKVWGIPCHDLSADWAAQRITLPDLPATIRRALVGGRRPPPTIVSDFYYPQHGFGMISTRMAEALLRLGGRIVTGATVNALTPGKDAYSVSYQTQSSSGQVSAPRVISTIPINALLRALPSDPLAPADVGLDYRDLICIFLIIDREQVSRDHWTYFPQPELIFGRIHEPGNWSKAMTPPGMTSLVAEIFTGREEETWRMNDEELATTTVGQLQALGLLTAASVVDWRVLRVRNAYPVYRVGYAGKLRDAQRALQHYPRLHLVGRTGAFRYMNSDGVLEDALALVDWLIGQTPRRVDVGARYVVP